VLICDAPDHGKDAHDAGCRNDRFHKEPIEGNPHLRELVHDFYKKEINLSTLRLNYECEKMLALMLDHYKEEEFCEICIAIKKAKKKKGNMQK
jgi:hypothetical protein